MNCIFLNPESYIICPNRYFISYNKLKKEGSNEISIWFNKTHKYIEISNVSYKIINNIAYTNINSNTILNEINKFLINKK